MGRPASARRQAWACHRRRAGVAGTGRPTQQPAWLISVAGATRQTSPTEVSRSRQVARITITEKGGLGELGRQGVARSTRGVSMRVMAIKSAASALRLRCRQLASRHVSIRASAAAGCIARRPLSTEKEGRRESQVGRGRRRGRRSDVSPAVQGIVTSVTPEGREAASSEAISAPPVEAVVAHRSSALRHSPSPLTDTHLGSPKPFSLSPTHDCIPYQTLHFHQPTLPWPTPQEAPQSPRTRTTSPRRSSGPRRGPFPA
jgi:hypothetical protein